MLLAKPAETWSAAEHRITTDQDHQIIGIAAAATEGAHPAMPRRQVDLEGLPRA
jgi:hypothetical protein